MVYSVVVYKCPRNGKKNANTLKGRIIEKGLTQEKLAEKIGMSQNTMSSRICGRSSFRVDEVKKICCILGIESSEEKAKIFLS